MRRLAVLVMIHVCVLAGSAGADEPPPSSGSGSGSTNTQAAIIHYHSGEQYYKDSRYAEAINEFQEAYRLSQAPALLFNISRCYERLGDLPHAREYLQKYVDSGKTEPGELPSLKSKLSELDRSIAEQQAAQPPSPVQEAPPLALAGPGAEPPRPWKTWKWVAVGVGGASLVVAALFAADAAKMQKDLEAAVTVPMMSWVGDLPDKYARGSRDSKLAAAFGVGGLALAGTGVVLFILDGRSRSERPPRAQIVPAVGASGVGASALVRF